MEDGVAVAVSERNNGDTSLDSCKKSMAAADGNNEKQQSVVSVGQRESREIQRSGRTRGYRFSSCEAPPLLFPPVSPPFFPRSLPVLSPSFLNGVRQKFQYYPLLFVSPIGTISVILKDDVIIMMTIDRTVRVCCSGKFAAAFDGSGYASAIMHPEANVYQHGSSVLANFSLGDKKAVFGPQGVIFTMKNLASAYVSSFGCSAGIVAVPSSRIQFDTIDSDQSLTLFYQMSEYGEVMVPQCDHIVQSAVYDPRDDGLITLQINGALIRQEKNGDVEINLRPRYMEISPSKKTVAVRTHYVDMGIQQDMKAFVKSGMKRVHVSRSGMVVSDGSSTTSMDQSGKILSI